MPKNFEAYSDEFRRILGPSPELKLLSSDLKFAEGVCWVERSGFLIVSDFLNDRIVKWSERDGLSIFRQPAATANGNTVDLEGRVVSCLTRGRSVVRQEHDGYLTTIADRYGKGRLTSPNDVVVKSDGTIWFTDPDYGFLCPDDFGHGDKPEQDESELHCRNRYRTLIENKAALIIIDDVWRGVPILVAFMLLLHAGIQRFRSGWRHEARTAEEVLAADPRKPVLYLRSFTVDDQLLLSAPGRWAWLARLFTYTATVGPEQELAFIMERVGPVVAIGKPGERLPELGAARRYAGDDEWRQVVGNFMDDSALVVIRAGETANV